MYGPLQKKFTDPSSLKRLTLPVLSTLRTSHTNFQKKHYFSELNFKANILEINLQRHVGYYIIIDFFSLRILFILYEERTNLLLSQNIFK